MRLIEAESPAALSRAAADVLEATLGACAAPAVALPTGRTPLGLYAELARRAHTAPSVLARARVFNLDEFLGVGDCDPHSYAAFLRRHLVEPLALEAARVRLLKGDAADSSAECRAYDAAIEDAGGLDLCVLGLGANGHIAFNEPGGAWNLRTHRVTLTPGTRAAQQPAPGQGAWVCPAQGLTLGIRTLLEARHVMLLIAGENKQAARQALARGVPDQQWPVTSLATHPALTVIALS